MSLPNLSIGRMIANFRTDVTYGNISPPGLPAVNGEITKSYTSTTSVSGWFVRTIGVSVKTPRPWPNGSAAAKQWNPYAKTETEYHINMANGYFRTYATPFAGQLRSRQIVGSYDTCFNGSPSFPSPLVAPNVQAAATKLLSRIKAMEWNAAETLGEVGQTAGLVVNTFNRIANAIHAVKRGKVQKAMEILNVAAKRRLGDAQRRYINRHLRNKRERQIASDWLAINYGVIPLMEDIQAAIDHLQNRPAWPIRAHASQRDLEVQSKAHSMTSTLPGAASAISSVQRMALARYVVEYSVDEAGIAYFRSLGLTNVPSLAWELYPGSLIIDWALPIGTWLSNMDATFGCKFRRGVLVTKTVTTYRVHSTLTSAGGIEASGTGRMTWTVTSYNRGTISSFPANAFPQFKNPVSAKRAANALAFLVQAIKTR